jgi:putative ABC transport system substrate-binding protein
VKRRDFITLRAQQAERMRRVGVLMGIIEDDPLAQARGPVFRQALADLGWTEGRNLTIAWRWAGGDMARVREYASELARSL